MGRTPPDAAAPRRSRVPLLSFFLAVAVLAAILGRAYHQRGDGDAPAEIPVLRAEPGPARELPSDPGGMTVPYRDMTSLHEVGAADDEGARPVVERLLPPPEEPLPRPDAPEAPPPASAAVETTEAAGAATPPAADPAAGETAAPDPAVVEAMAPDSPTGAAEPAPPAETEGGTTDPIEAALALAPPPVRPAPGFPIQLGAWHTRAEAEAGWEAARARAADVLGPVDHFVVESAEGAADALYRLQVGPMPSRDSAASLCRQLLQRDVPCFVAAP